MKGVEIMKIEIAKPVNSGTTITINNDTYNLFGFESHFDRRIIPYLKDSLKENKDFCFIASDAPHEGEDVSICCGKSLTITYLGKTKEYPISKNEFINAFLSSFKENAIYWCAAPNYWRPFKRWTEEKKQSYLSQFKEQEKEYLLDLDF